MIKPVDKESPTKKSLKIQIALGQASAVVSKLYNAMTRSENGGQEKKDLLPSEIGDLSKEQISSMNTCLEKLSKQSSIESMIKENEFLQIVDELNEIESLKISEDKIREAQEREKRRDERRRNN